MPPSHILFMRSSNEKQDSEMMAVRTAEKLLKVKKNLVSFALCKFVGPVWGLNLDLPHASPALYNVSANQARLNFFYCS